jgi:tetratricopeptide (TPR) repeat protein/ribosomal protein L40E
MEDEQGKVICPSCDGRLLPLIECGSCGVKTVREGLAPVQGTEKCPVCETSASVVFECGDCHDTYSFNDITPEKGKKSVCPMCGALVEPDAEDCSECGSSFAVEGLEEREPAAERLRKPRKVVGEFVEDDVLEIMRIPGVGRLRAEVLCKAGYTTLNKLNKASLDELARVRQIGMRTAKSIKEALQMMYVEPVESQRLLEESVEEEFECPVCKTIVSAYDTDCSECGTAFERVVQDEAFIEEMEKVGEEKSSLSLFDMMLLESPKDPELWVARGGLLRKMENYDEALRSYEKALAIRPDLKTAWIAKAEILSKLGRLDEAASCYREIVDESATAAGIELGKEEDAMAALEELLAEDCPSCGSSIPLGSNTCPSCGIDFAAPEDELPLEELESDVVTEELLEEELKELESGVVQSKAAKGPGLTNGNGMINGKGRINGTGLVNGRGRINGTGLVNGRGLVNGKGIINGKGRVNGLINGNGFTNGLSLSGITKGPGRRMWPRYIVLALAFMILVLVLYGTVPEAESRVSPISIDGQFQDWEGVSLYTDQGVGPNPDTTITGYGFRLDNGHFSFLVEVQGAALGDITGYDSYYLFIDKDNDPSTGYVVRDMGADYVIDVFGGNREVIGVPMYGYVDTQDRLNFTEWGQIATGKAAVSGNRLEGQLVNKGSFDLSGDFRIRFCADDYEGGTTYSQVKVGPTPGALLITQSEAMPDAVIENGSNDVLQLTFHARGADVHIDSVSFDVNGASAVPIGNIDIDAGSTATRTIAVDISGSTNGDLIEISVANVVTDTPYTISGDGAKAYYMNSPSGMEIDGWFGDWESVQKETDSDNSSVVNPDLDIQESAVSKDSTDDTAYFYVKVGRELLGGVGAPQVRYRSIQSSEPGQPTPVMRLERMGGEDTTYFYIDSNTSDGGSGALIQGIVIMPDYMIKITGIYGRILKKEVCHWSPGWNCTSSVQASKDTSRMEISAVIPGISSNEIEVVIASTDWRHEGDTTNPVTRTVASRGPEWPEPMQPTWPSTWISVVTDADDGHAIPSLEILEVYFDMDSTYLYVRIRTETTVAPSITAYTWWIYLDTDADGNNDWIVVEMSGTGSGEVHGLAWNDILSQWGTGADWQNTIGDSDGDSAARSTTMDIGIDTFGCIDFAVLRTNIGTIDDETTIAAADEDVEDQSLSGKTERSPSESLDYIVDATGAGQIPEFEFVLLPILLLAVLQTVMIKRRKRYSGS